MARGSYFLTMPRRRFFRCFYDFVCVFAHSTNFCSMRRAASRSQETMKTVPKLILLSYFSQFYRCSGGSSRSQKTMETVHETGAESDRLASTLFANFFVVFSLIFARFSDASVASHCPRKMPFSLRTHSPYTESVWNGNAVFQLR